MPPKKANRSEAAQRKQQEAEEVEAQRIETIDADPLLCKHSAENPAVTVGTLFSSIIKRKDFKVRPEGSQPPRQNFDWSALKAQLAKRDASSPRWFLHVREEDLLLDPNGLDGEKIECAVIVETSEPTLAPLHMVLREHRPYSDLEDNPPERIMKLADLGFWWRELRADDGAEINVFVLQEKPKATKSNFAFGAAKTASTASSAQAAPAPAAAAAAPAAATGFGAKPATASVGGAAAALSGSATTSFGAGSTVGFGGKPVEGASSAAPVAKAPSFGFGSSGSVPATAPAAAPVPAKAPSFGFGAGSSGSVAPASTTAAPAATTAAPVFGGRPISPKPAEVPRVGFGAGASAPANGGSSAPAAPVAGFGSKASAGGQDVSAQLKLDGVQFALWTDKRLKEMIKEVKDGSRIVIEDFPLPAPVSRKVKVKHDNDMKGKIDVTVTALVRKEFAKKCKAVAELNQWIDECPTFDEKLTDAMDKARDRAITEEAEGDSKELYDEIDAAVRPVVTAKLEEVVAQRKAARAAEVEALHDIQQLLKSRVLAPKESYKVLKYYPKNDVLLFRPHGKVGGIHESGESVDVCEPPAYVPVNALAARAAALRAQASAN